MIIYWKHLTPGFGWVNYGVTKCITTSKTHRQDYIKQPYFLQ